MREMIGERPTLADIVLTEQPIPYDLYCDEEMPSEEELGGGLSAGDSQSEPSLQVYVIKSRCAGCDQPIKVSIQCSHDTVVNLHSLLLGDLSFLCPLCYKKA